jgi:hypothetical protein
VQYALSSGGAAPVDEAGKPINLMIVNVNATHFRLERLSKKTWAPVQKFEHTGKDGEALPPASVVVLPPLEQDEETPAASPPAPED